VEMVTDLWVPYKTCETLLSSQERFCSTELWYERFNMEDFEYVRAQTEAVCNTEIMGSNLCLVVLCSHVPCGGPIPYTKIPTKMSKKIHNFRS
jgi:hypothetical protein